MIVLQFLVVISLVAQNIPWPQAPRQNPWEAMQQAQKEAVTRRNLELQNRVLEQEQKNLELQNRTLDQDLRKAETQKSPEVTVASSTETNKQIDARHWNESLASAKAKFADFDQVMAQPRKNLVPPFVAIVVTDRDNGAELAYWLTLHPDEERRLVDLVRLPASPTDREIRRAYVVLDHELDKLSASKP